VTRSDFAVPLSCINAGHHPRGPGACTHAVCEEYRKGGEVARLIDALLGWETASGKPATPADLEAIREVSAETLRLAEEVRARRTSA